MAHWIEFIGNHYLLAAAFFVILGALMVTETRKSGQGVSPQMAVQLMNKSGAAVLDVRSPRPGQRLYHLTGADVRAPFGVDVVQVTPSSIALFFERSSTKNVPVLPVLEGQPAEGFMVDKVTADPPTVDIVGPASSLKSLASAVTEAVSVEGASKTVVETVTVGPADPSVRLRGPQTTARVTVAIVPVR